MWLPAGQFEYACPIMDSFESHYLTIATFRVKDTQVPNEVEIDDRGSFKATIRKVCICGSPVEFDRDTGKWLCSASGADLDVKKWNCVPLIKGANLGNVDVSDLKHPDCTSVVTFGEDGDLIALLKIEAKDHWVISDPLPIFECLSVKPFETDLLLRWFLNLEDDLSSGLSFEIFWNVADPNHRRVVECLNSSQSITIYFLDSNSLAVIGAAVLELYQPLIQSSVKQAFALIAALPKDENARREQLSALALGQEASMFSLADKMGICPVATGYMLDSSSLSLEKIAEMSEHMRNCPTCKRLQHS
ncbi:hypothetical protein DNFV4_02215 [Nitrospira tepida]|uniref:Uncharacterized protein n=2 Tax=Nitrospira tepida TaxID=2973512 RepID=A0AA86MZ86_9BACT|nr:hypothetical protein DNFV4_02215 [Nitrospira tepida]